MAVHPGARDGRPVSSSGPRYMSKEEYQARRGGMGKPPLGKPPHGGKNLQTNVHMANANATFNSFIDENAPQWQTDIASAYNQVTGVSPHNYHTASVNSRQFQLALQARRSSTDLNVDTAPAGTQPRQQQQQQQRLMEQQSRAMMEASKAKHHAMVAQAHAAQRNASNYSLNSLSSQSALHLVEVEGPGAVSSGAGFAPKPPAQPVPNRGKAASLHRLTR